MNIEGTTIWQQSSGDTDRDYSEVCLNWDVILNGAGYAGPWPDCLDTLKRDLWSARKITDIRRFADEMHDGDLVVLRLGTATVLAVGEIVGSYQWFELFGDVDGWDLQHTRRVRWLWKSRKTPKRFPTYALKQGDTTQRMTSDAVKEWLSTLGIPEESRTRPLVEIPKIEKETSASYEEISEYLFGKGVASHSIETLLKEIDELVRIAKWYQKSGNPSEFETVAYLVVPLLRALGWTPQKMAIEWNRVDLALFSRLPRENSNLAIVVEAKKKDNSCLTAVSQAQSYAQDKPNCDRLIVTDGLRYGIHIKKQEKFHLYAYLNLTRLQESYPIYACFGTKAALLAMTPEWNVSVT